MKKVMMILAALLAIVVNSVMTTSCDSYEKESEEEITTNFKKAPKEPEKPQALPALSFKFERIDSVYSGKSFSTSWYAKESTTDTKVYGKLSVAASHSNDGNAVNESEMNKVVDVEYARKNTTYGELKSQVSDYGLEKRVRHSMRIVTKLGDGGTICYLDGEVIIAKMAIRDTLRNFPADSIEFGKAQVKSLRFVGNTTRAAETYVDKNDPRKVEVVWSVPVVRVHDKVTNNYEVEVSDTAVVFPIKKNNISEVKTDTLRQMVDPSLINCIVRHHLTYKNGETGKAEKSATIKCSLTAKPEWSMNVSTTTFSFLNTEDIVKGRAYSLDESDGVKTLEREDIFTVVNSNGVEFVRNEYSLKHQSVTITDEFGAYTFDFADPAFKQVSTKVQKVSETATLETARLYNTIEVSYLGGRQTAEETVLLNREIEEYLVEDYVDVTTAKKVTTLNKTAWSIDRVKKYTTGREVRENALVDVVRVMNRGNAWEAIEDNSNYQTGDYEFKPLNSEKVSKTDKGVTFVYFLREKEATALVKLNNSTQKNTFKVTEGEECVIYFNGKKVHDFGKEEISVKRYGDSLTGGAEKDGYKVYNYVDKVSYTVNGNTQNLDLNGTIKVKKAEEPKANDEFAFSADWGSIKSVCQTTTMNEAGTDYCYVLCLQFMNNYVVPGIIEKGSNKVYWMLDKAEKIEGTNKFNSAYYSPEQGWMNCTANDVYTKDYLVWYRGTVELNRVTFGKAASLNWDGGYKKDGHWTIFTNHYNLSVIAGVLKVTDKATGSSLKFCDGSK